MDQQSLLYLLTGFLSALMSSMSGAGAALFATPVLLTCGVALPSVLAANQFAATVWTPIASRNYLKGAHLEVGVVASVGLIGVLGAWTGFRIISHIPVETLKSLVGVIILIIVIVVYRYGGRIIEAQQPQGSRYLPALLGFPLGAYQAVFGSGNILLCSLMFCRTRGFDFKRALAHTYAVAFLWCLTSALLGFLEGWMSWGVAVPLAIGSFVGAGIGSAIGKSLSTPALRRTFLSIGAVMGLKLLYFG